MLRPDPDQPIVLVTAPTGSAAYNINGSTIHLALSINDRSKSVIPNEKQCMMQVKLEHLMLLITDEISMVGYDFFQCMNEVICSIKRSVNGDWGGGFVYWLLVICFNYLLLHLLLSIWHR